MADVNSLLNRIDAEFAASEKQVKEFQAQKVQEYKGRQERLELFTKACEQLQGIWRPRLEALAKKFGDKVQVKPTVTPTGREASFKFQSPLARIDLRFSASTDTDVHKLVLDYNLDILPILMKFESHARTEFPLEAIDAEATARWIDDRIVDFVKAYLAVHQNQYYLKDHMVADPISNTQFPKYAAAASLEWQGKKYYFVGDETCQAFKKDKGISG